MAKKGKVLIIDDEPDLLETIRFRLDAAGYDVIVAEDGLTGIQKAKEKPDLIIMDIMMPEIDGFETLKKLKEDEATKKIPTLIFSCGKEEEGWAKKALSLGAAGYIVKPFETDSLLFTVENFIKK
ncbi:MAG: response regulator [Candidatus Omnitrophota bacterium]|nr:response regulator [Candidatus Omnitrophota bacterium]|tara:strand:- start:715 stop:1089 length:375 start_codon:yes stop_codon:yes gene_type:complete